MPEIRLFDPALASENHFEKRFEFHNLKANETAPDDPPNTLEQSINYAKNLKVFESIKIESWHLWLDDTIVAELVLEFDSGEEENAHLFDIELYVLPQHRMKGYTKLLLPKIIDFSKKYDCRLVLSFTTSRIPAGQVFAEYLKASKGIDERVSQLVLNKLDTSLIQNWLEESKVAAQEFEMGFWGNIYPEEELEAIAKLINVMNTAPKGDLDLQDTETSPERLRETDAYLKVSGSERRFFYVRHKASGELAGFTDTYLEPETPEVVWQSRTGVIPKYRGNKLGKWLKASMLQEIMRERPQVKFIRTDNATSNAPMLAINNALGFELYESVIVWQIEVDKIKTYLKI